VRLINQDGRLTLVRGSVGVDVHHASGGLFDPDPQAVYDRWDEFVQWATTVPAAGLADSPAGSVVDRARLGPPVPRPRQIFAIGLNYAAHADESGFVEPDEPVVFTKFVSSIAGPRTTVALPEGSVDWEVELVVVIGRGGRNIPAAQGWHHVAGVMVGQDLSERRRQHAGPAPQFSLAKSHAGFSPTGPALVTPDELADRDDLEIGAEIDGEVVQAGRTSQFIFPVPELIARLSAVVELYPGDLIFTGTPAGVGAGRTPPRFLQPGEVLCSYISGVGELVQTFTAGNGNPATTADRLVGLAAE
jgi:2-keto-4-pentenoate hydratase/2-oxohepta-3-ene-1,7-dioic acid hydratase in catechol pathway